MKTIEAKKLLCMFDCNMEGNISFQAGVIYHVILPIKEQETLDFFQSHFFDVTEKPLKLSDAVLLCIRKGLFTIQKGSSEYGTSGIVCHFHQPDNLEKDTEFNFDCNRSCLWKGSVNDYIQKYGMTCIAQMIADAIEDMGNSIYDNMEANHYLYWINHKMKDCQKMISQDVFEELKPRVVTQEIDQGF